MAYHVEQNDDTIKRMGNHRFVTSQRGLCNSLFCDHITRLGNIHNGYVKMNKHNQIVGFKWQDDITIDENESYNFIQKEKEKENHGYIEMRYYKITGKI